MANGPFVTEAEVIAIPAPAPTLTFQPLPHGTLIDELHNAMEVKDIAVTNKYYSMSREGQRIFGVWEIEHGEVSGALGFRNANDKSMAVGLTSGDKVFVCSNLAFSGEWIEFRKHTSGMTLQRLRNMISDALNIVLDRIDDFTKWHESLKRYDLAWDQSRLLSFGAVEKGIIAPSALGKVIELYHDPGTRVYDQTLHGWHGSITQTLRDRNLVSVQNNHAKLTKTVKSYINWLERPRPAA
jgi:hypothetical protein